VSITTSTTGELLDRVAELIVWAEQAGLRGDFPGLWRRHDALLKRVRTHSSSQGAPTIDHLRLMEAEVWAETLGRTLLPEILERAEAAFASAGGSALWAELAPDRRRQVARTRSAHARSVEEALRMAVLRFERSPGLRHLARALQVVGDLHGIRSQGDRLSPEDVADALQRIETAIRTVLPVGAREFIASEVEERFDARAGGISTWGSVIVPRSSRDDEVWSPLWEQFAGPSHAEVEPADLWFAPQAQARYDERRLAREVDQAHASAELEDRRRTKEIAEEHRKREEERRAAEEQERIQAVARKAKEDHERILQRARELAPERAKAQAAAEGYPNFKMIIESQRDKRIRDAEAELIGLWTGQKGTRKDTK
jgi:hypothetical protein